MIIVSSVLILLAVMSRVGECYKFFLSQPQLLLARKFSYSECSKFEILLLTLN